MNLEKFFNHSEISKIADFFEIIINKDEMKDIFSNFIEIMKEKFTEKEEFEIYKDTKATQESVLNMKYGLELAKNNIAYQRAETERNFKTLKTATLEIEVLKMRMKTKAEIENLLILQNSLEDYTPLTKFNELLESIPDFVRTAKFNEIIKKIVHIESYLKDTAKTESIMRKLNELREQLAQRVNRTITKDDFEKSKREIEAQIKKLKE